MTKRESSDAQFAQQQLQNTVPIEPQGQVAGALDTLDASATNEDMKNANMIVDQDDEPAISNSGSVDNAGTTDAGNLDAVAFNAGDPQVVITDTDGISDAITQDAMSSPSTVSLHL
ncbi:hypothetical protein V6N13_030719 [Hibiscus sabdariffa]